MMLGKYDEDDPSRMEVHIYIHEKGEELVEKLIADYKAFIKEKKNECFDPVVLDELELQERKMYENLKVILKAKCE